MSIEKFTDRFLSLKGAINKPISLAAQYISKIPRQQWHVIFLCVLFAYVVAMVVVSISYSPDARLFPLLIGVPLLSMIVANIVLILYPSKFSSGGEGVLDRVSETMAADSSDTQEIPPAVRIQRELKMTGWVIGALLSTWLIGILNGFAVFLFAFLYIHENSFIRAGGITVVTLVVIYALFVELLSLPLWEGVLIGATLAVIPLQRSEHFNND